MSTTQGHGVTAQCATFEFSTLFVAIFDASGVLFREYDDCENIAFLLATSAENTKARFVYFAPERVACVAPSDSTSITSVKCGLALFYSLGDHFSTLLQRGRYSSHVGTGHVKFGKQTRQDRKLTFH